MKEKGVGAYALVYGIRFVIGMVFMFTVLAVHGGSWGELDAASRTVLILLVSIGANQFER